jgi:Amidohydrolase family/WD40-like Beta Propeller Repeat
MSDRCTHLLAGFLCCGALVASHDSRPDTERSGPFAAQGPGASAEFMAAKGTPRLIDFTTNEGTLTSLDVSPDGAHVVFDLLGHIYLMGIGGGHVQCLTQGSGVALNYHPRFSPNGHHIAFISDRSGQANVWIMNVDGSEPRPLYLDLDHRYATPVWAADGQSVFVTRLGPTPGRGWHRRNASAWQLPLRGVPTPLLESTVAQYYVSSASRDGRMLYVYSSAMVRSGASIYEAGFHNQALNLLSKEVTDIKTSQSADQASVQTRSATAPQLAYDSGGSLTDRAEFAGTVSPDGKYLAFARVEHTSPMAYRGHTYRYSTSLVVLNLATGQEHRVIDQITKDLTNGHAHYSDTFLPGYAWTSDSSEIVISVAGKIVRVPVEGGIPRDIPYRAHVQRVISGQVRRQIGLDDDAAVPVRFIQWPTASPDGGRLVFAALGRLWLMDLPAGKPKPLTADPGVDVQITPAWSKDGNEIAFATWNEKDRGQVWTFNLRTSLITRVSKEPSEYIWPTWTPEGEIVAVKGPGATDNRDAWDAPTGWWAVRFQRNATAALLVPVGTPWQPIQIGKDGRIFFTAQWDATVADRVTLPYPDAVTLELGAWRVMSVDRDGSALRVHATFRAGRRDATMPIVSGDGHWIAYQADYQIFTQPMDTSEKATEILYPNPDPRHEQLGRQRADALGGAYPRWHDDRTLEFASGNRYVTYDVISGAHRFIPVSLQFKRDRAAGSIALLNARIIPIDDDRVIEKGTLVVRDGRLVCVGKCSTEGVDRVLDLAGKTVIPGLVDVHDHIASEESGVVTLRRPTSLLALAYGVTSIIDPAVSSMTLFPLAEMTDAGRALGPRTFGSADEVFGSVGGTDGTAATSYGYSLDIRTPTDAEYQVARRAAWGAVIIKNYRQTSRQQQQWLIESARRHGLSVTAEGSYVLADLGMVMDGQTGWEHFLPAVPLYKDVSTFVARAGANYSATLSVAGFPDGAMFYYRPRANLPRDPKYTRFASQALLKHVAPRDSDPPPIEDFSFPILAEGVADVVHAGGYATIGEHGENPGIGSHWEMWTYATALRPIEVLRMATLFGARTFGMEHEIGSLAPGKRADLIVLNTNPLERIENTADILYVMKGGRLYDASTLVPIWPAPTAP